MSKYIREVIVQKGVKIINNYNCAEEGTSEYRMSKQGLRMLTVI